jgi:cytochrome c biogenesis protein ResB
MWGSKKVNLLEKRLFGKEKIPNGYMLISRESTDKKVTSEDFNNQIGELPFGVRLNAFRIEYYPQEKNIAPELDIKTTDGQDLRLAAKPGEEISVGPGKIKLKVIKTYKNFKINVEDNKKIITDNEQEGKNPAIEVTIETPDGNSHSRYIFEQFGDLSPGENGLQLSYKSRVSRTIQNYCSDVTIIENGKAVLDKTIKVNQPLHYGGYHFNQDSYDAQMQTYTILSVASDNGLYMVYAGFWVLCIGTFWQFWLVRIKEFIKSNNNGN